MCAHIYRLPEGDKICCGSTQVLRELCARGACVAVACRSLQGERQSPCWAILDST